MRTEQAFEITPSRLLRSPFAVGYAEDLHSPVIMQVGKQLGCDEEILAALVLACDIDELIVDDSFSPGIHALIDLIHEGEWGARVFDK